MKHTHTIEIDGLEVDVTFDTKYVNNQIDRPNGLGIDHVRELEIECIAYNRAAFTEDEQHVIDSYLLCNNRLNDVIYQLLMKDYHEQQTA